MGLAEHVDSPAPAHHNAGCALGLLLATFDDDERAAFDRLRPTLSDRQLAELVASEGYRAPNTGRPIGHQTFGTHRRGDCCCDQAGLA